MYRFRQFPIFLIFTLLTCALPAQSTPNASTKTVKDVDPLALDVLRAVATPLEQAKNFSFKALISEEELATNGQMVTFFHSVDVRVQRPDKIHLIFRGRGQRVDFYGEAGKITMYSPDAKLYTDMPGKDTIDAGVTEMNAKGVDMPIGPFLRSDFYDLAAKIVDTGYVIGRVKIADQDVHQLAFTGPDADWQLWVTGGETPRFVRAEIVNKKLDGKPRTAIQFMDWDLNPTFDAGEFTFNKPADAHQIDVIPGLGGK